jgi:hypothetical protein
MPTYTLPKKPSIATAVAAGRAPLVSDRIAALATTKGYTVGEGGIQVHGDGSVTIDADRDPKADWAAFDPVTLTPEEAQEQTFLGTVRQWITALEAGGNLTVVQRRQLDLRLLRMIERQAGG